MYECRFSKIIFYYKASKDIITFNTPRGCDPLTLYKKYKPSLRMRFGFSGEWTEYLIPGHFSILISEFVAGPVLHSHYFAGDIS